VRRKANLSVPCSSKIPFGIFLSPELTTAFLCLLNLKYRQHINLSNSAARERALSQSSLHQPRNSGEALSVHLHPEEPPPPAAPCPTLCWRLRPRRKYALHFLVRSYRNKTELVLHAELHADLPEEIASQQNENDEDQEQNQHRSQQVLV